MRGAAIRSTPPRETGRLRRVVSLADWARVVLEPQGQAPAGHHRLLIAELERLARGEVDRLMVLMPPGAAKSTYASVLFPAWWYARHPATSVIAASHSVRFSEHLGRQVRNLVREHGGRLGYSLAADQQAAANWRTDRNGHYFATGVRSSITGRRADLAIIDDPVRSHEDVESRPNRDRLWDWYRNALLTRLKPGARVVLAMTRWHEDDIAGRLLSSGAGEWTCLKLPALAEEDDPLGRAPGEALWPDWEDAGALVRKRTGVGERAWAAQFQQRPRKAEGGLIRSERIRTVEPPLPQLTAVVRAWDLAATQHDGRNDPDWTVGVKLGRDETGGTIVLDVVRIRGSAHEVECAILKAAGDDGRQVPIGLPQDPGQAGKAQASYLIGRLAGYRASSSPESGSKATRAMPVAAQIEARNVTMLQAPWNAAFADELKEFPSGAKDDQVDALSRAFEMLVQNGPQARRLDVPMMQR